MQENDDLVIDLGKLMEVIFRQWRLIIGLPLIAAILAGLVGISLPKTYKTEALVATTKVASSVSFGSSIQTMSEEQLLASGSGAYGLINRQARLESYVQLVKNPKVAQEVMDQLGDRLNENDRNVGKLLEMVDGKVAGNSDSISISVTNKNPQLAADIANAWAQAYVDQVNAVYSESGSVESYDSIKQQTVQAKQAYDDAQAKLEDFLTTNKADEYQRQIDERQAVIDSLSIAYTSVISSVVNQQAQAPLQAFSQQVQDLQTQLDQSYTDARQVDQFLANAKDMRDQVQNGGDGAAASNALALNLLKAQIFANSGSLGNLLIQTTPVTITAQAMLTDLDSLISALQNRQSQLDQQIKTLSSELISDQSVSGSSTALASQAQDAVQAFASFKGLQGPLNLNSSNSASEQKMQELEHEVRDLNAKLEGAQANEKELTRARDLAWDTYKNLATKQAELSVATQTKGTDVSFSAPAPVPEKDSVSVTKNVLLAMVVGLFLGIFAAYAIEFWWAYKGIKPYPIKISNLWHKRED